MVAAWGWVGGWVPGPPSRLLPGSLPSSALLSPRLPWRTGLVRAAWPGWGKSRSGCMSCKGGHQRGWGGGPDPAQPPPFLA